MLRRPSRPVFTVLALAGALSLFGGISAAPSAADPASITSVVARGNQTCASLSDGTAGCWGANDSGQLGDGTTTNESQPVGVSGLTDATQLSAGYRHTCALVTGRSIECWGSDTYGQLGDGGTTEQNVPADVSGISTATQVSAGDFHTCALLSGGSVKCWGFNYWGELGNGTTSGFGANSTPVSVSGVSTATQVAAGGYFSCALLSGGSVKCWGQNTGGELGNGTYTGSSTPVTVSGISDAVAITANYHTACAVISDGTIDCWGDGALGDGNGASPTNTPVEVSGISTAAGITNGAWDMCAWLSDGSAKCWGNNDYGQLGDGTTTAENSPVSVSGVSSVTSMAVGDYHTCAVENGADIKCWGLNSSGQLGDETTTNRTSPVSVSLSPAIVSAPAITPSGPPADGGYVDVSSGTWFGSPTSYGYQWQSCSSPTSCSNISGATGTRYYPTASVYGLGVRAEVTASNGSGSASAYTAITDPVSDAFQPRQSFYWLNANTSIAGTRADVVVNSISPDSHGCVLFRSDVEDLPDGELIQAGLENCGSSITSFCGSQASTDLIQFAEIHDSLGYTCNDDGIVLTSYSYVPSVQEDSLGVWHAYLGSYEDTLSMNFSNPPDLFGESGEHHDDTESEGCSGWSGSATFGANTPWQTYDQSTSSWTNVTSPYYISKGCWTTSGAPSGSFTISN